MSKPSCYVGSDHAGQAIKETLLSHLKAQGFNVQDCGVFDATPSNYAIIGHQVAKRVQNTPNSFGILMCGTGIGISIAANRNKGIRAALCHDAFTTKSARAHNDANVLVMGARVLDQETILMLVDLFLETPFEGGRHVERIEAIEGEQT